MIVGTRVNDVVEQVVLSLGICPLDGVNRH
jgi:hypothetical protein